MDSRRAVEVLSKSRMKALQVLALVTACWCDSEPYFGFGHRLPTYSTYYTGHHLPSNYNPYIPYSVVNRGLTSNFPQNTQIYYGSQQTPGRVSTTTFVKDVAENHQNAESSSSYQKFDAVGEQQVKRLRISPQRTKEDVKVNARVFAKEIKDKPIHADPRIKAPKDKTSPSAAAALAYLRSVTLDDLCGKPSEIYIQSIFNGKSKEEANAEATRYYIQAYNGGARLPESGACKEADVAYREAFISGDDPILKSAEAFINAWPGVKEGNPCAISGIDYVNAIVNGKSHTEANTIAADSFADAFKALAIRGKPLKDPSCAAATRAFFDALPEKPDPANAAAFTAFIDKIFEEGNQAPAYDPVCLASLDAFLDAYNKGEDLLTANLISARAFFKEFAKGSKVPADSACAAATKAYTKEIQNRPSPPNAAAMIAYINEAIATGNNDLDPVCAASAEAYFDAYIEKKDEAAANEAAAVAYMEAVDKTPNFDRGSPCGKAATAYIEEFEGK